MKSLPLGKEGVEVQESGTGRRDDGNHQQVRPGKTQVGETPDDDGRRPQQGHQGEHLRDRLPGLEEQHSHSQDPESQRDEEMACGVKGFLQGRGCQQDPDRDDLPLPRDGELEGVLVRTQVGRAQTKRVPIYCEHMVAHLKPGSLSRAAREDRADAGRADNFEPSVRQRQVVEERRRAPNQDGDPQQHQGLHGQTPAGLGANHPAHIRPPHPCETLSDALSTR